MKLPAEFTARVKKVWADRGEKWLAELSATLSYCRQKWKLSSVTIHPDLSYNLITHAVSETYGNVVLKIGVVTEELETEISALQHLNRDCTVRLIDSDSSCGAFLLEEISPAKPLCSLKDSVRESHIAARIIASIPAPVPDHSPFPTIESMARVFDRIITDFEPQSWGLPVKLIRKAKKLVGELTETTKRNWLLHGDLHHENILFDESRGWTAIDPKGVIGDRSYECARFLPDPRPEFLSCKNPIKKTEERVEFFSSYLKEDRSRILGWAFCDCILGACWDIEDSMDNVDHYVEWSRIFEQFL